MAPGPDPALLNEVQSLVANITAGTATLRQASPAGPGQQKPVAGPSGLQNGRLERRSEVDTKTGLKSGADMKFNLKNEKDAKTGLKKSPPVGPKKLAACRAGSPVAGPSRAVCSAGGSDFAPVTASNGGGDVTFGTLQCSAVGLQYYPGQLKGGEEPVRLLLANGNAGTRRDVRVVNEHGLTSGYLSREFSGVLAPLMELGRVRLDAVCMDHDHWTAELEVTVRGREQHRRQVCDQLQKMGFPLDEPLDSPEPDDLFNPVKPGRAASPERTLVTPRDPSQAVSERWAAMQRSLKEVEPCPAVASRLYPHQKQALGWMMSREASGSVSRGTDAVCGGILADDMGLGKTLQVISLILTHFKAGRPLAVPVPWRRRAPPAALAPPPQAKSKVPLPGRPSPKVDWSNFSAKLKKACEETPDVKSEGASGSGLKNPRNAEYGQRKSRTKRKPARYIDSSDEEEEKVDLKRLKPEPTNAPSSACAGPSSEPTAGSAVSAILIDSDEDLLSDGDDSPRPGAASSADRTQTEKAGPGGSSSAVGGEYIPMPPSYCDHDGRSSWPGPRTTLIVCPLSVLENWETQLEQHVHRHVHLRVRSYHGPRRSESDLVDADVVLTTYATLGRELDRGEDSPLMRNHFLRVVLDEGHTIRNPRSIMARAAYELRAERRWVLTGTPVQNRLKDLWSLLHFLRLEPYASQRLVWNCPLVTCTSST